MTKRCQGIISVNGIINMRHSNSGAANFIRQCELEKKSRAIRTGITGTGNRIPGNRIM